MSILLFGAELASGVLIVDVILNDHARLLFVAKARAFTACSVLVRGTRNRLASREDIASKRSSHTRLMRLGYSPWRRRQTHSLAAWGVLFILLELFVVLCLVLLSRKSRLLDRYCCIRTHPKGCATVRWLCIFQADNRA